MASDAAREEILRLFRQRPGDFVSGEEVSRTLGVSRTAVWKQIRLLRDLGYGIEALPSRGYRLVEAPDTLIPAEVQADLGTRLVGRRVIYVEETDSTNRQAADLGEKGGEEGTVLIADRQSAGKGRLGRSWASPAGVNLYASVLLRPPLPPHRAAQLTFFPAVAVARAITEVSGLSARVKWPNDILLGGRKVAGLLNEMRAEAERIHFIVLGIGVNLNMRRDQFPSDLRYPATSVALETGSPVNRLAFTRALLRHLDRLYDDYLLRGVAPVLREWESLCDLMGEKVAVDLSGRSLVGTATGLDDDGALLLRLSDGRVERVLAGDVRPC